MQRNDYVLAILSAGGEQASFSPVQVQKLFFLLDREVPKLVGGPYFDFQPYDFGPFDKNVYDCLDHLELRELASKTHSGPSRRYSLTPEGHQQGNALLDTLPGEAVAFISQIGQWVRSLSFSQLVSAIYRQYPAMKANSIFQQ